MPDGAMLVGSGSAMAACGGHTFGPPLLSRPCSFYRDWVDVFVWEETAAFP